MLTFQPKPHIAQNFRKCRQTTDRSGRRHTRQAFQKILFPNGLHFDIKEKFFGTDDLSPLFSVINNKKEPDSGSDCEMVTLPGIEPGLPG